MKLIFIIFITTFVINTSYSQEETFRYTYEYLFVDEIPQFGNSSTDLYNYIYKKIEEELPPRYYSDDLVIVSFIVDENGCVGEIKEIKFVTQMLKNAVIKVLSEMPNWKPGKKDGKSVRVKHYLQIDRRIKG